MCGKYLYIIEHVILDTYFALEEKVTMYWTQFSAKLD